MQTQVRIPINIFQQWIQSLEHYELDTNRVCSVKDEMLALLEHEEVEKQIGTLTKRWGLVGWDLAEIGHPVFEFKNHYIIYLTGGNRKPHAVKFHKEDLAPVIKFN